MRLFILLLAISASAAEKLTVAQLVEMVQRGPVRGEALLATLGEANIQKGTAVLGRGEDFVWAVQSASRPELIIDDSAGPAMIREGSGLWYAAGKLTTGTSHRFVYKIDGKLFGGSKDVPAYGPESYLKPGVPTGTLSEKLVHTSKIYDGLRSDYWIYVPAQYDPKTPAALMVWQDGQSYNQRDNDSRRILDAVDNLTHERKIPVMIQVFISPGRLLQESLRSVEYDTVSDRYARMLRDELLPEVAAKYNIRKDAYSRGISGASSGGICAFNVAWQQPDQFSRVLSWIGSFTALKPEPNEGGQAFPVIVRAEPKRNIRVWLQDGAEDLENKWGSWPLQNIALANSLKMREYDFHLSFGTGTHNSAQGSAEFPESFLWLWRDYDSAKTEQAFEIEPAEKAKPMFRVQIYNRDHDARH